MRRKKDDLIYVFSKEKIEEFKNTPLRARLKWLEEANLFINRAIGLKKRAQYDERFKGLKGK